MTSAGGVQPQVRDCWTLASGSFWADERTLVGGDPFRSVRLTPRGAGFVRDALADRRQARSTAEIALLQRLNRANLLTAPTRAPVHADDVTLVVPAKSGAAAVQRVLDSAPGIPAIVIDDGSALPLDGALRHDAALQVVRHESSVGPAAARNLGAHLASTRWIVFCDADIIAPSGWVSALIPYADDNLAVAPRVVTSNETGIASRFERAVCALDMGCEPGFVSATGVLSYVPSAALLVDRAAFLERGGFDESLRVGEDVDFIWRAADGGIYYEPAVQVAHRPRARLGDALSRRAQYGASSAALAGRHPDLMRHGSFPLAAAAPWLLAMAGRTRLAFGASALHLALAPRSMPGLPAAAARRAAASGQRRSALALSRMLSRPLLPLTLLLSLPWRGFRYRALVAAAAATALQRRSIEGVGWQLADDAAYTTGAWRAAVRTRRFGFLLPQLRLGAARDRTR